MEIKQLKYFLTVTELGSFSKAAVVLSVAQPVLSRHIRSLEEELNVELFYRNGRGIVVTEAGQILLERAQFILGEASAITSDIDSIRGNPGGQLILALPPTAGSILSVPLIQRFRESFPRVKLRVQEVYSGHVLEWLSTGRVDIAVLYDAPKTSTLLTEPLVEEDLLLIGPSSTPASLRGKPIDGALLGELPLILPSHPHGLRVLVETLLGTIKVIPEVEYEIDSLSTTLDLVERGVGYTILPYASVIGRVHAGKLVCMPIVKPRMSRQLVLATSTQRPTTIATRSLASTVKDLVRDLVAEGAWMLHGDESPATVPAGKVKKKEKCQVAYEATAL